MSVKIKPPQFKEKNYERYKLELQVWREITDIAKEQQGILSLPEDTECNIREQVFDELTINDLKAEARFEILLTFLDTKLAKYDQGSKRIAIRGSVMSFRRFFFLFSLNSRFRCFSLNYM